MSNSDNNQLDMFKQQYEMFESIWKSDEKGVEFVYARDLQRVFEYTKWSNFLKVIEKAKISCNNNNIESVYHFAAVGKMINLAKGAVREVDDLKLTRYACYLIAQNGDPRKSKIAFAQHYFAVQTRKFEKIIERMENMERLESREKLKNSEKDLGSVVYERGVSGQDFGILKSKGDQAFFGGYDTRAMKDRLGVPENRPLNDFTSKPIMLGKALANAITTDNVKKDDLIGMENIKKTHISSNKNVRKALLESGITPEDTPPQPDIKKVEKILNREKLLLLKGKAMRRNE